ncbi:unnamed protein product [Plutella xylostella]|uniref:(diamondback moth) hypothetical protein n=1 Tax=Plutella xylostella TaxID=51655 RepID=A0A8S4GBL6_PLUXY|nr:unnamed protein product [Plutella xylostella]
MEPGEPRAAPEPGVQHCDSTRRPRRTTSLGRARVSVFMDKMLEFYTNITPGLMPESGNQPPLNYSGRTELSASIKRRRLWRSARAAARRSRTATSCAWRAVLARALPQLLRLRLPSSPHLLHQKLQTILQTRLR